eukprot:CAMPEP_0117618894 /NCGR_PEP_ID=MMETSP0784-20121206/86341_1 /TAXON_ID=39447 /ORGANISM="" /LENGTH=589 /DNA_ID=CAMNT_0005422777 /DNA_START=12 /DNA_END=1778 /DNA_ORIENTATION=+
MSRLPSRASSGKKGGVKMSTHIVLARFGLEACFPAFEKAGLAWMEPSSKLSDEEAEEWVNRASNVLVASGQESLQLEVRAQLWKALRLAWSHGPGHTVPFVDRHEVARLFLPKLDYKTVDAMIPLKDIEADRHRQIVRKTAKSHATGGRGPTLETQQFEVYRRLPDMWYQYKDLHRCVDEWCRKNPRTMLKEDPREEDLKKRIRDMAEAGTTAQLIERREGVANQRIVSTFILMLRAVCGALACLMFYVGYSRYKDSPRPLMMSFVFGSRQWQSGVMYLVAFWFAHVVYQRRHADSKILRLRRMLVSLERHMEQISNFRVESEAHRLEDQKTQHAEVAFAEADARRRKNGGPKGKVVERRVPKSQKAPKPARETDAALAMWVPEAAKKVPKLNPALLWKELEDSYSRFPDADAGFRRKYGDRMQDRIDAARPALLMDDFDEDLCVVANVKSKQVLLGLEAPQTTHAIVDQTAVSRNAGGDRKSSLQSIKSRGSRHASRDSGGASQASQNALSRSPSRVRMLVAEQGVEDAAPRQPSRDVGRRDSKKVRVVVEEDTRAEPLRSRTASTDTGEPLRAAAAPRTASRDTAQP